MNPILPSHPAIAQQAPAPQTRREVLLSAAAVLCLAGTIGASEYLSAGLNDPHALQAAADKLNGLPPEIGRWTSTNGTISDRELRLAQICGYVRREYRHEESGFTVTLTLLAGPAGPMSVHPPTACFEGVGYTIASGPHLVDLPVNEHSATFSKVCFRPPESLSNELVRVFWAWSTDGLWQAPANPRVAFRGKPALYKLYVVDRGIETASDVAQAEAFLTEALPVIRIVLQ